MQTTTTITITAGDTGASSMLRVPLASIPAIIGALTVGADGVEDGHEVEVFSLIQALQDTWEHAGNALLGKPANLATVTEIPL